jgi:spoIIIJ-associated protein
MTDITTPDHPGQTDTSAATGGSPAIETSTVAATRSGDVRTPSQLEEEGDVAADYIEELLDITDLDGDIDIDARDGRAYVSVNSSQESNLRILARPDTVNALQELTRLAVQAKTGSFSRLILDVGGSREARAAELALLVDRAIEKIEQGAQSADLPPMSSYERKLVHDIVADRQFTSESEGEGAARHTVISRA